jgi:hypothetical protein
LCVDNAGGASHDSTYQVGFFPVYFALGINHEIFAAPRMWGFELKCRFDDRT